MKRVASPSGVGVALSPEHKRPKTLENTMPGSDPDLQASDWTRVEKRKNKKIKKQEAQQETNQPRFMYSNTEIMKRKSAVSIDDIRDLVVHLAADAPPPNWLKIENARNIQKVVVLWVPGITPDVLSLPARKTSATSNPDLPISIPLPTPSDSEDALVLPFVNSTFSHACPTRAPGDQYRMHSVLSSFFSGPVGGDEKKRRIQQRLASEKLMAKDPAQYILTLEQMMDNEYPIPSYMADVFEKPEGWVETPKQDGPASDDSRKVYAIDCEMCLTDAGKELARVAIIDYHTGIMVYDQLVKPSRPVVDYLTRWSGITAAALEPVTTTLEEVQAQVLRILTPSSPSNPFTISSESAIPKPPPPTPILLGHSLESDLKALKLCHPVCIDTALMYHHPRGRPLKPGLAWLTKKWIGREIQTRGEGGHDPEEDARACVDLLKKKLENGPGFGEFKVDYESIFERMTRSSKNGGARGAVVDHGNPSAMHGAKACTCVPCKDDEDVLRGLIDVMPTHQFVYGRFMALADALSWTTPKQDGAPTPSLNISPPPPPATLAPILSGLNSRLLAVHTALPPRTALVIFSGHSDPRRMAALNAKKSSFDGEFRAGKKIEDIPQDKWWTTQDGRELEDAVAEAKKGLLFLSIKQ